MKVLISLCTLLLVSVFPACFGASVQCAVTPPQNVRNTMIVTVDWLAKHLNDSSLVLLHVGEKTEFEKEHIPGAIYISVSDISLSQAETPLTLQLPPAERLKETFEKMGVGDNSRIIVYFGKDWVTPTTRVYFTLDYLGLGDQTSILDGGLPAWKTAGQSVTAEVKSPVRATLTPHPNPDLVASLDWVKSHLNKPDTALIDARVSRFYEGRDPGAMPRAGRIPGATNIPYPSLTYEADLKFKDPATLATMLRQAGVDQGDTVVSYCHIGQQATSVYFVARYLGFKARLYDGSFDEWSRRDDLPVDGLNPSELAQTRLTVVTPEWVTQHANDPNLRIVDTRLNPYDYFAGHLPQAVHLADASLRGPSAGLPVQFYQPGLLGFMLSRAGIKAGDKVVVYSDGMDVLGATMTAYVLERLGHKEIYFVDGGWTAYKATQKPSQEYPKYQAVDYDLTDARKAVSVTLDELKALMGKSGVVLIDARPAPTYRGDTNVWTRNGHIPGAINLEWRSLTDPDNPHKLKPVEELRAIVGARKLDPASDIIVYCGTGREATLEYMVLKHVLGFRKVRLYEGSWTEYCAQPELQIETGPEKKN